MTEFPIKTKVIEVLADGRTWYVPAEVIANDLASYFSNKSSATTYQEEFDLIMTNDIGLRDWFVNAMRWSDVAPYAVLVTVKVVDPVPDLLDDMTIIQVKDITA